VHLTLGILRISSSFLRLIIFLVGRLRRPRPSAGNAIRWALAQIIYERKGMNMNIDVLIITIGALFLAIGLVGLWKNLRIKEGEASTPNLYSPTKVLVAIIGVVFIVFGIWRELSPKVNDIAGAWTGNVKSMVADDFSVDIVVTIQKNCRLNDVCGTYSFGSFTCSGDLVLTKVESATFVFIEQKTGGTDACGDGNFEYLQLLPNHTLSWGYSNPGGEITLAGTLKK